MCEIPSSMGEDQEEQLSVCCMTHGAHTLWYFSPVEGDEDKLQKIPDLCERLTHLGHTPPTTQKRLSLSEQYTFMWPLLYMCQTESLSSSLICSLAHQNERIHHLMRYWCSGKLNGCLEGELRAIVIYQIPWEMAHVKEVLGPPVVPPCPLPRNMNPLTIYAASGVLLVLNLRVPPPL